MAGEGKGYRVLLVDDDRPLRDLISAVLTDEEYEVIAVSDGLRALEVVGTLRPHAILLDLTMPGLDGPGFVAAYHAQPGPHAPIAVMSASGREVGAARTLGVSGHLSKPFDFDNLLALASQLVHMKGPI